MQRAGSAQVWSSRQTTSSLSASWSWVHALPSQKRSTHTTTRPRARCSRSHANASHALFVPGNRHRTPNSMAHDYAVFGWLTLAAESSASKRKAWASTGDTAVMPSRTPPVLPGRFMMRVRPRAPASGRDNMAACSFW